MSSSLTCSVQSCQGFKFSADWESVSNIIMTLGILEALELFNRTGYSISRFVVASEETYVCGLVLMVSIDWGLEVAVEIKQRNKFVCY